MSVKALFLDRDGVINVDHGYVHKPDQFEFVPGILDVCRAAKRSGYRLVVVTNQAGIGRGYYSEADFEALNVWMRAQFAGMGAAIDGIYFCPCHPEHGVGQYKTDSPRRKPHPGMLLDAAADLDIDLSASILIGDKTSDIEAGLAAGVRLSLLLSTNTQPALAFNEKVIVISSLRQALEHVQE